MEQTYLQSSSWYQALPLSERVTSLISKESTVKKFDTQLAEKRMQKWRSQSPFPNKSYFAERLEMDDLSEEKFLQILGESNSAVENRFPSPPEWFTKVEQAFSETNLLQKKTILPSEFEPDQELLGFLYLVEPLISQGIDSLDRKIQILAKTYSNLPFDPNTVDRLLYDSLLNRLFQILHRTLILELNVLRVRGLLAGNTPQERFRSFLKRLRQPEVARSILQEYPIIARQSVICIDQWVESSREFLQRLCSDRELIHNTFSLDGDLGLLVRIDGGAGDSHRGGKAVLIAEFDSGLRLVYKPRSLAVDVHFQELLTWLNERGNIVPFRTIKVLDRSDYGWSEFITAFGCNCEQQVRNFYERQGGYLAILYALEATDFHLENLIAAGEDPVLIDLEALFVPDWQKTLTENENRSVDSILFSSVIRSGLLPLRIWSNNDSDGIDLSGLGGKKGQLNPHASPTWEGIGTDRMKLTLKRQTMAGGQNQPTLNDTEIDVWDYAEVIAAGFTKVYQLLLQNREELQSATSPLARFANDEVRVILRATRTYEKLLRESHHPDMLRDALERDRLFDFLWKDTQSNLNLKKAIFAEREDLWNGDIPIFTTHPDSCHLFSSTKQQISNFCERSGLDKVRDRLKQLNKDDLARQLWLIRASVATLTMNADRGSWSKYPLTDSQNLVKQEQLITAACKIGDRLEAIALRGGEGKNEISWLGLSLVNERSWTVVQLGVDLYDGLSGIALFLAYLSEVTKVNRYKLLAQSVLTTTSDRVKLNKSSIASIGGFSGWGGIIYVLTQLGTLWNQPELIAEAESYVDFLAAAIDRDEQLDIIGGAAGCILSLLSLYRCQPSPHTLAIAVRCGDRLLDRSQSMARGKGWVSKGSGNKHLAGFSHGAAGIALALLQLSALTGEGRFRETALDAIAYERSLFSTVANNWPDLREFETAVRTGNGTGANFMTAWCHGASGIGLARLGSLPYLDDVETRAESDAALQTTLKQGFGVNHSLCHGDLGNLELLLQASQLLDDPQWKRHLDRFSSIISESIDKHGWLCGVPLKVEVPGLMTGLAGIGYQLLRLAQPDRIPSILLLAPPR